MPGRHRRMAKRGRWRLKQSRRFSRRRFLIGSGALVAALSAGAAIHWLPMLAGRPGRSRPGQPRRLLNGVWDFQPATLPLAAQPSDAPWHAIRVPSEWNMTTPPNFATDWGAYNIWDTPQAWDQVDAAWYRTRLTISEHSGVQHVLLFEAVNFEARVYVNGHLAGTHAGGTTPFTVDLTPFVHPGENTLWVAVTAPQATRTPHGFQYPMGSWWGQRCAGIWQDVWLIEQDMLEVSELTVMTSVRRQEITIGAELANHGTETETAHVSIQIWDGPQVVLRRDETIQLAQGKTADIRWTRRWNAPHLWSPGDPHLYDAVMEVRVGGIVRDTASLRFGFREVWVDRDRLILNGHAIRLFGDEWHYFGSLENSRAYAETWYRMAKDAHANYVRLHAMPYPPVFYDVADEVGMLIVAESAIYGSSRNLDLESLAFWQHAREHLTARVKRDRHHPSVILWSAENEVLVASGWNWAPRVAALKDPIMAADPTRPVYFEGDHDPEGRADLISWHYPLEITQAPALPDAFYAFVPGRSAASRWTRQKPLMISEFGLMWEAGPKTLSVAAGNAPFFGMDGLWAANALITQAQIEGFRAAGITGLAPWNLVWYGNHPLPSHAVALARPTARDIPGPRPRRVGALAATLNPGWAHTDPDWHPNALHHAIRQSFRAQAAIPESWAQHAFSGETLEDPIIVHNDTSSAATFSLSWRWAGGEQSAAGQTRLSLQSLGKSFVRLNMKFPDVDRPTAGTLTTELKHQGHTVDHREQPLTLFPRLKPQAQAVYVAARDQDTLDFLSALGIRASLWDGSDLGQTLVVPEGAAPNPAAWSRILSAVQGGARVVVLAQPPGWSGSGMVVGRKAVSRTFVQAPGHPLIEGWHDNDLSWWRGPGEAVAQGLLTIPRDSAALVLTDGGASLAGAGLLQWSRGDGTAWFCQYPVVALRRSEPLAERLLRRLVTNAAKAPRVRPLAVWGSSIGNFLGIPATTDIPDPSHLLIVDAADPIVRERIRHRVAALRTWVRDGGRLWIHGGSSDPALVQSLTGFGAHPVPVAKRLQFGALKQQDSRLTHGLSNAVLDWTDPPGALPLATSGWQGVPKTAWLITAAQVDWSQYRKPEQIKMASVLMSQSQETTVLLWMRHLGEGDMVIDELEWNQAGALAGTLAARMAAALTQN